MLHTPDDSGNVSPRDPAQKATNLSVNDFSEKQQTDFANAELFVKLHGERLRYCHAWKSWLIRQDDRWKRDDSNQVYILAFDVSKILFELASRVNVPSRRKECIKHAIRTADLSGIKAFLQLAQSMLPISKDQIGQQK